ncbi:hypothetical protein SteCoe_34816 [Stentor coeruleus]|uniref:FYVE-type domain-containing protein n=1 Tax=Stentor coeruleus TaxID=5963 RepID=A0A1R2ATS2_9CILI|nr:hypothetical protein SteCoe_34816 [Stentor coeruleus]
MDEEESKANISLIILKVKSLPSDLDKKVSKQETNCLICGIPFAKKGVSQTSKHVCRFCFHACCSACSPLTALHPENNESERICLKCYTNYLKISVEEESSTKNQEVIRNEVEKFQRDTMELHIKEVETIKENSKNQEKQFKDQISRLSKDIQERDSKIMTMSFAENERLSKKDESIGQFIREMKEIDDKTKAVEAKNKNLLANNLSLETQNKNLKEKLSGLELEKGNLQKEGQNLLENIKRLQEEIDKKPKIMTTPAPKSGCMNSCIIY